MSRIVEFSVASALASFTDGWVESTGISLPLGRVCANGTRPAIVTSLRGWVSGRGASRSCVLSLGYAVTSSFTVASSGSAQATAFHDTSWLVYGGTADFRVTGSGSFYFGRSSSGLSTNLSGFTWSGNLGGYYTWLEGPTAPSGLVVTPDDLVPGKVSLSWNAPADNGGVGLSGYRVEYSLSPTFASGVSSFDVGPVLSAVVEGLVPGSTYYFRVAARNSVTAAAGTWSVYSGTTSVLIRSGARVWDGSSWKFSSIRVWNGSSWVPGLVRVWDGESWVTAL